MERRRVPPDRVVFDDIETFLPNLTVRTVLDIGANVGKMALAFRRHFPEATVWAFEPIAASYAELVAAAEGDPAINCFQLALGAAPGTVRMIADGTSPMNRIVVDDIRGALEDVTVITGDTFCRERSIDRIEYLKIDAEGHDLEVLRGFERTLREQKADLVEIEAGIGPDNRYHVPLAAFTDFLDPLGYRYFRFYQQVGNPDLSRLNAVFVSAAAREQNPKI